MRAEHRAKVVAAALLPLLCTVPAGADPPGKALDWPSFRGPGARGVADGEGLPLHWDPGSGENVRFTLPLPGRGHASPVIAGDLVLLAGATAPQDSDLRLGDSGGIAMAEEPGEQRWWLMAVDKRSGEPRWQRTVVHAVPRAGRHVKASQANATPATDGETVVAILGSQGLFALDVDSGEERWRVDLGVLDPGLYGDAQSNWGHASSPIVDDDRVFVQVDRHRDSFLAAFDLDTGRELWRVERDELPVWATPTLHRGEREELIVVGGNHVRAYRPSDGSELWRFHDHAEVKTPTPFVVDDRIVLAGGYRGRPIYALKLGGRGDLSSPEGASSGGALLWRSEPGGPYTSTPIAYRGHLYSVRDTGILMVHDLDDGSLLGRERVEETFSASPVASDGNLYFAAEGGTVLVVKATPALEIVARNDMGEPLMATPAISDGTLYLRGAETLWAIGATAE